MLTRFKNRADAGRVLAGMLSKYAAQPDAIVLALPRGGVPVAYEVAVALGLPLDIFLVRKLGVPGHEELAMGAIASGGVRVLNDDVVGPLNIGPTTIERVAAREQQELERREAAYRDGRPRPNLRGRTVILIDDGLATGSTMLVAIRAIKQQQPARIVAAVPTAAPSVCAEIGREADEIVCAMTPEPFYAVGLWYDDFSETTDDDVRRLLQLASRRSAVGSAHAQRETEAH
ncbi:MAG TPA: phosphoribosyltransferase [Thermomicrobiales bacterium]|nr:phosphoribosyltransferase [Thermomicrobiales bacterium]